MKSGVKLDWQKIEQEYVTGEMGLRDLAEEHHVAMSTMSKHAKVQNFAEKRKKYRTKVGQKALTRASTRDAKAIARIMTATEKTIRKLNKAVTDETVFGYLQDETPGTDEETGERRPGGQHLVILDKADTKALVNLSTAIRNLSMAVKVMYPDGDSLREGDEREVVIMPDREESEDE